MKLQTRASSGDIQVIDLDGDLDVFSCVQLKQEVDRLFKASAAKVIINLDKVSYIDSRGVGVLIYAHSLYKKAERGFYIIHVNGSVRRVIELTKLLGYLPIANTEEEAAVNMN